MQLPDGHRIEIIAHRGASAREPEGTRAAYVAAIERGADGLECDVRLTADQIPVCVHDASARRMAGVPRAISAMTLAELRELDFGARGPVGMTASRDDRGIFTLEQFCELAVDTGRPIVLAVARSSCRRAPSGRRAGGPSR